MAARSARPASPADGAELRRIELGHPVLAAIDVRIRRGRRTRHVRLHVDEHGSVTASMPQRFPAERLDPIVRERAEWLHGVLTRMELKARDTEVDLERGDPVRLFGSWVPTSLERGGGRATVRFAEGRLQLRVPADGDAHDALVAWYRREARTVFEARVAEWSAALGLRPGKVSVREQRTRWGSCTHRGDLSFNWRLLLAPAWVLDSIVVHELCHIEELNHSDRFWALLDQRYPRHLEASEWLREHGAALRISRPSQGLAAVAFQPTPDVVDDVAEGPAPVALRRPRRRRRGVHPTDGQVALF
ncbi:MAG: hypothetical protein JWM98_1293 [Thermoleophilia bacterium]|nr:hypothetical protein [Thermoleophilia bacterium]